MSAQEPVPAMCDMAFASIMRTYNHYKNLQAELAKRVGYCNRQEIPADLVCKIAEFCDAHPDDMMTAPHASSLINQFFRKRNRDRWRRLIQVMDEHLRSKKFLIGIFFGYRIDEPQLAWQGIFGASQLWGAIDDFEDGYHKANLIGQYSDLFTTDIARLAYQRVLSMASPYKTRALGGIYPVADATSKAEIVSYLRAEFQAGHSEAAYRLKFVFRHLDERFRAEVVSDHLTLSHLDESYIAYFVIHNAAFLDNENAQRLAKRIGHFRSEYYRNRCLLKLRRYLPAAEIDALYHEFMESFTARAPTSELLHNLYQFSAVRSDFDKDTIVGMALKKIGGFDDSRNEVYQQQKYAELSFLVPNLSKQHKEQAFAIADSVRGGYRKNLLSRLRRHFANEINYCTVRYPAICY